MFRVAYRKHTFDPAVIVSLQTRLGLCTLLIKNLTTHHIGSMLQKRILTPCKRGSIVIVLNTLVPQGKYEAIMNRNINYT